MKKCSRCSNDIQDFQENGIVHVVVTSPVVPRPLIMDFCTKCSNSFSLFCQPDLAADKDYIDGLSQLEAYEDAVAALRALDE